MMGHIAKEGTIRVEESVVTCCIVGAGPASLVLGLRRHARVSLD